MLLGDVLNDLMSQSVNLQPREVDCATATASNADNTTMNRFSDSVPRQIGKQKSLTFDPLENLVYYKSVMDISVANATQDKKLATWNTEKGFSMVPDVVMEEDKRFFRIGVIDKVGY